MLHVRPENVSDYAAVRSVNEQAFGQVAEADLVEALREQAAPTVSLVAEADGRVVGHIFFSPATIEGGAGCLFMGLAPMAVCPGYQRQGIGAQLVRAGLQACADLGAEAVVVLGHPAYYPRFGFRPAATFGLRSEYDVLLEAFMAVELVPNALREVQGTVAYHAAFRGIA